MEEASFVIVALDEAQFACLIELVLLLFLRLFRIVTIITVT